MAVPIGERLTARGAVAPEAIEIVLTTLPTLQNRGRLGDGVRDKSANALFQSTALETHYRYFAREAEKTGAETAVWGDAALLHLSARKFGAPEARSFASACTTVGSAPVSDRNWWIE